ncbi:MAG: acyl-CoA dehydrogenase family protein [Pseudomonadota bacterium]
MTNIPKGGSFLLEETNPQEVFTTEDFTLEHKMIADTASGFVTRRVTPRMDELESKKEGFTSELLRELGDLGLLAADIPEEYGGIDVDKITSIIIAEEMGRAGSLVIAHAGQVGIGSLPIVFFGNDEQKKKYLPGIAAGEHVSSYALTEPGAGSDAMALTTKATLSPDGKFYILNGVKQFISNAGFGDTFIVFAKIDGTKLSVFIVDGKTEGFTSGVEEKKMGIKGASTRTLFLDDVKVPVENLLFEIGRGHIVAFNILNMGRMKCAANSVGMAKYALELSATYANERRQFNAPIARFGMIKEKLAKMATRIYVAESMLYRTGGLINNIMESLDASGPDGGRVLAKGIEEYALECSLIKVFATEVLAYAVDEGVQIHGGYGYIAEYPIERLYRDARIFRIFEGTNEINRNLIPTLLIRRGTKGDLPLIEAISNVKEKIGSGVPDRVDAGTLAQAAKDIFLFTLGAALEKWGDNLMKEQEILERLADLSIGAFAMESSWLRSQKAVQQAGEKGARLKTKMATAFIYSTIEKLGIAAAEVLAAVAAGNELKQLRTDLAKLMRYAPVDVIAINREIAAEISAAGKYIV